MQDLSTEAEAVQPVRPWIYNDLRKALARATRDEIFEAVRELNDELLSMTSSVCDEVLTTRIDARTNYAYRREATIPDDIDPELEAYWADRPAFADPNQLPLLEVA